MKLRRIKTLGLSVLAAMTILGCQLENKVTEMNVAQEETALELTEAETKASRVGRVFVYSGYNRTGQYRYYSATLAIGSFANQRWPNGASMDNSIKSVFVPPGVYISVASDPGFKGITKTFGGGRSGTMYNMNSYGLVNKISCMEIHRNTPGTLSYSYLKNFPNDRENGWSNECQGITNDGEYWYISTKWNIRKVHKSADLNASHNDKIIFRRPFSNSANHIGDISYFQGELYIPVEYCQGAYPNRIYALNVKTGAIRWAYMPQQNHLSWVAINPDNGLMYSSEYTANRLMIYNRNFANGSILNAYYAIPMSIKLSEIQGGTFDKYNKLYLSNSSGKGGIHVFQLFGFSALENTWISPNGYKPSASEEMEGLTWWDLDLEPGVNTRLPGGQLHWILLDNDTNDDVYLKHVRTTWR